MKNLISLLSLCILLSAASCGRKTNCSAITVDGYVKHHDSLIPNSRVFYKKGSKDSPGKDTNLYDGKVWANSDAYFTIPNLEKDDYHFYSVGYDSNYMDDVTGGMPLTIECSEAAITKTVTVSVSE